VNSTCRAVGRECGIFHSLLPESPRRRSAWNP